MASVASAFVAAGVFFGQLAAPSPEAPPQDEPSSETVSAAPEASEAPAEVPTAPAPPAFVPEPAPGIAEPPEANEERTDDDIAEDVEAALAADPYTKDLEIAVSVENGQVELEGLVDSRFLQQWTQETAEPVQGVVGVTNKVFLSYVPPRKEDWEIRDKIMWRWGMSPYVDADTLAVTVVNGIAIITGTVRHTEERRWAAQEAAREATRKVIDRLRIKKPTPIVRLATPE
jgi:osmotically-inducible protein OsmY